MTKVILKQLEIFPSVTMDQLRRLTKSYLGYISDERFLSELNYLKNLGLIERILVDDRIEYRLGKA